jgi:16S rRNA (cytidine1402-2'-O)-methyltransferase
MRFYKGSIPLAIEHLVECAPMGTLYLVATPIGNLEDISPRALRILRESALIAAEDTRVTKKLTAHFGISTPLIAYFEHNKKSQMAAVLNALAAGDVAVVSDAGTPVLNDPGFELVKAALAAGREVVPIPGPSAPMAALTASGLPADSFLFIGYLNRMAAQRRKQLESIAHQPWTVVALEAPHRLLAALEDILAILGDRPLAVARELTKLHEEIHRGSVRTALERFRAIPPLGEITLVIGAAPEATAWGEAKVRSVLEERLRSKKPRNQIAAEIAEESGWRKRDVYALLNQK